MFILIKCIGTWPGSFDHDLTAPLPGLGRQLAERFQFSKLSFVVGVGETAGAKAVAEAIGHVVFAHDLAQLVEMRVPGILLVVRDHPGADERAAAADDAGDSLRRQLQMLHQNAGVDGHVIDALLRLVLDHVEEILRRQIGDFLHVLDRLIHRHGADRHGRGVDDRLADRVDIAAGREVHHGVGSEMNGGVQLLEFVVDFAGDRRIADIRIDLATAGDADGHRFEVLGQVNGVRGDDHAAASDLGSDQLRVEPFAVSNEFHLGRDDIFARRFDLRHGDFLCG